MQYDEFNCYEGFPHAAETSDSTQKLDTQKQDKYK